MYKKLRKVQIKKLCTIVAVILLAAMYLTIFRFSAESADESSEVSAKAADFIMRIYYRLTMPESAGGGEAVLMDQEPFWLEIVIRKLAHFTEYMCIGFLSYAIVLLWCRPVWKGRLLILLQVFLSGALDEFHQYFVPGRAAMFRDVLIDTAGGCAGIFLIWMCYKKVLRRRKKKNKKLSA